MPIPVNSAIQVSFRGTWAGQRVILLQNYVLSATTSAQTVTQDLESIGALFNTAGAGTFRTNYLACLPSNYTLDFIRCQQLTPTRSVYVDTVSGAIGAFGGSAATGNLQFAITLHTELGGRNQIAVKKIGPAPTGTFTAGAPDPTYLSGPLATFGTELTQQQVVVGLGMTLEPIVLHPLGTSNLVKGFRLPTRVGTMRRRTLRVGE